jgi:hypothetical protein
MHTDTIPELDDKELRKFGLTVGAIVAILFGLVLPWFLEHQYPAWPWGVLAILGGWSLIHARSLRPVYWLWMRFGLLASKVTTPVLMTVIFALVILPASLLLRLFRTDPMRRQFERASSSYRVTSESLPTSRLERPF